MPFLQGLAALFIQKNLFSDRVGGIFTCQSEEASEASDAVNENGVSLVECIELKKIWNFDGWIEKDIIMMKLLSGLIRMQKMKLSTETSIRPLESNWPVRFLLVLCTCATSTTQKPLC